MIRKRVRLRFSKLGDLRFIGHRDLVRALARLFQRAGLKLSMSEGYHPKPRLHVPAALAVGLAGTDEVVELELAEDMTVEQVLAAVRPHCPAGVRIRSADVPSAGTGKAEVVRAVFQLPVPVDRQAGLEQRIKAFLDGTSHSVQRQGRKTPVDIRPFVAGLMIVDDQLHITLRVTRHGSARPREVLVALQLADLEQEGCFLTRTSVELRS